MSSDLWSVNLDKPNDQIDILKNIVISGHLAPSSHNTQPWRFQIKVPNIIEIYTDKNFSLEVADPSFKELYISCGCTLANMEITSLYYGFNPEIEILPESKNIDLIGRIKLHKHQKNSDFKMLHKFIQIRRSNRSLYETEKSIPEHILKECETIISDLPVKAHFATKKSDLKILSEINQQGIFEALSNPAFRKELSSWVRHNWTQKGDGLTGDTLGLSNAMSILLPLLVTSPTLAHSSSEDESKAILSSSACCVISAKDDSFKSWIYGGIAYERIALLLTSHKIDTAVLTAAIEIKDSKNKLINWLNERVEPQMFFRIGYATKPMPHSPRRIIDKVLQIS